MSTGRRDPEPHISGPDPSASPHTSGSASRTSPHTSGLVPRRIAPRLGVRPRWHVPTCRGAGPPGYTQAARAAPLCPWGRGAQPHSITPPRGLCRQAVALRDPPHPSCVQVGGPQSSAPGLSPLGGVEEIPRDPRQCPPCGGGAGPTGDPSPLCPCHTSIPAPRGTQLHREQVNTRPSAGREVVPPRQAGSACPWGAAGCAGCRAAPTGSAAPTDLAQGAAGV